jgi:hypothetical protein
VDKNNRKIVNLGRRGQTIPNLIMQGSPKMREELEGF